MPTCSSELTALRDAFERRLTTPDGDKDDIGVLADLFGQLDDAAGKYAAAADEARVHGMTCTRAYESLTKDKP